MDTLCEMFSRGLEQLLGRAGGPLHFRLFIMPLVVTFLAIRAGMRDARERRPPFFRTILSNPVERRQLLRSAVKDVGRIFIVAVVLDTTYQLAVLHALYPVQLLIIAVGCAIVPYVVIRGPVSILMRALYRNQAAPADPSAVHATKGPEDRPTSAPDTDH
jgi:hypothetical protein